MLSLGMDIGTSTVKLVLLRDGAVKQQWMAVHQGRPFIYLKKGLSALELDADTPFSLCVTGSNTEALLEQAPDIPLLGDIPAIVEGVRRLVPQTGSVIEIGSQGARFITDLQSRAPQFSVNEHCAGGTGSFFEDQMSRVGCKLEDYSLLVEQAQSIPRLSGRCAVFAKTDIIHRQQEGVSTPDILLGLCNDPQLQGCHGFCGKIIWTRTSLRKNGSTRWNGKCEPSVQSLGRTVPLQKIQLCCSRSPKLLFPTLQAAMAAIATPRPWIFPPVPMQC